MDIPGVPDSEMINGRPYYWDADAKGFRPYRVVTKGKERFTYMNNELVNMGHLYVYYRYGYLPDALFSIIQERCPSITPRYEFDSYLYDKESLAPKITEKHLNNVIHINGICFYRLPIPVNDTDGPQLFVSEEGCIAKVTKLLYVTMMRRDYDNIFHFPTIINSRTNNLHYVQNLIYQCFYDDYDKNKIIVPKDRKHANTNYHNLIQMDIEDFCKKYIPKTKRKEIFRDVANELKEFVDSANNMSISKKRYRYSDHIQLCMNVIKEITQ